MFSKKDVALMVGKPIGVALWLGTMLVVGKVAKVREGRKNRKG